MYTRPKMGGTPRPPLANPYCTSSPTPPQDIDWLPASRYPVLYPLTSAASSLRPANLAPAGGQPRGLLLAASWSSIAINFPRRWRRRAPRQPTCVRRCSRTHACIPGGWPCILVDIHYPPPYHTKPLEPRNPPSIIHPCPPSVPVRTVTNRSTPPVTTYLVRSGH